MRAAFLLLALPLLAALLQGCTPAVAVTGAAAGVAVIHDRRTTGTVLDDQTIELKAADRLANQLAGEDQAHVNVTSYNNVVLLTGECATPELRARAEQLIHGIAKVSRIHNEIGVLPPSSLEDRLNDSGITVKVKYALTSLPEEMDLDFTLVKVVTERNEVYLMGLVKRAEAEAVTDRVRRVAGVRRVVKIFDYLD
ncbi:BON domain-containing protein [Endothiovibrio diazotrophicus]